MENEWRMDANLRAYFPSVSANRWLAVRLEFIGSVIILAAAVLAIVSVSTGGGLTSGMVGLAVSGNPWRWKHFGTNICRCPMPCKSLSR